MHACPFEEGRGLFLTDGCEAFCIILIGVRYKVILLVGENLIWMPMWAKMRTSSSAMFSVSIERKATASLYQVALSHKTRMYHFPDRLRERGPTISIATLLNGVSIIGRGMSGAGCI